MRVIRKNSWLLGIVIALLLPNAHVAAEVPNDVPNHAKAAALIDVESGRLLYSKEGDTPMRIASLTKIMTAIVAIEHGKLTDKVKTSKRAFAKEGSSIFLKLGEEMELETMLYGLMLRSGNDAATAIAEHVGGSEEGFVYLMNEKAKELGLTNSHFMNPHGLDAKGHYSSANDLAKMTAYALHNPTFKEIVKTKVKKAPNPHEPWDYEWTNKNRMLQMYDGADGVKTGYTKLALRCLVSSATRDGQQLAAVTINDGDDWADHKRMLDWGFENFPLQEVAQKGQAINGHPLEISRTLRYPLAKGEKEQLRSKLILTKTRSMDYKLGERGTIEWYIGDNKIGVTPVNEKAAPAKPQAKAQTKAQAAIVRHESSGQQPESLPFVTVMKLVLTTLFGGEETA
ncbi:D-alanyl-D-alanine carboxypeptidase family protein [Paenibacillus sp. GCM10027626]|uniref:D-alanyl-D-alanine carboxypeptidase family protein n=1 Tax=Paenibacillus sp. GCM10027626 TaxID=3273411 RepID=UPI00363583B9